MYIQLPSKNIDLCFLDRGLQTRLLSVINVQWMDDFNRAESWVQEEERNTGN